MNGDRRSGLARYLAQKSTFPAVRLDKRHAPHPEDGQNEAGKARAAADIEKALRRRRNMLEELCRIPEMPPPGVGHGLRPDEIYRLLPMLQKIPVAPEPVQCFT